MSSSLKDFAFGVTFVLLLIFIISLNNCCLQAVASVKIPAQGFEIEIDHRLALAPSGFLLNLLMSQSQCSVFSVQCSVFSLGLPVAANWVSSYWVSQGYSWFWFDSRTTVRHSSDRDFSLKETLLASDDSWALLLLVSQCICCWKSISTLSII